MLYLWKWLLVGYDKHFDHMDSHVTQMSFLELSWDSKWIAHVCIWLIGRTCQKKFYPLNMHGWNRLMTEYICVRVCVFVDYWYILPILYYLHPWIILQLFCEASRTNKWITCEGVNDWSPSPLSKTLNMEGRVKKASSSTWSH